MSAAAGRMRPLLFALCLAGLLGCGMARPARAWLPEGHMATGAIAFDVLARHDDQALPAIARLMQAHPEWARFEARLAGLAEPARTRRLLELMAVWPDEARGGPFDHDDWHYSQVFVSALRHLVPFAFGGAEAAFRRNLVLMRDTDAAPADRAVALCWVIHIVGDMHQPLHAALWIGWRFPTSDAGGNWAWVRPAQGAAPQRLHFYWDAAARATGLSRASPDAFVARLEQAHPFEPDPQAAVPFDAFDRWIADTRRLAFTAVYERGAFLGGVSPADAPVLDPSYVERVRAVGASQIAVAGNRIGGLLLGLR